MKQFAREILSKLPPRPRRERAGFSLIELLLVLTIIIILAALAGPSLSSVIRGNSLSQGGQMIQDQLDLYRQLAVNNNYIVEARFYNFIDSSIPGDTGHYRGIQAFKVTPQVPQTINTSGTLPQIVFNKTPITRPMRLPPSIIIDAGTNLTASKDISYLIKDLQGATAFYSTYNLGSTGPPPLQPVAGVDPPIFNVGTTYTYVAFQFEPDGSTNLTSLNLGWTCYMTLHALVPSSTFPTGDQLTYTSLPKNYYTIQIDPSNGHVYSYRP